MFRGTGNLCTVTDKVMYMVHRTSENGVHLLW